MLYLWWDIPAYQLPCLILRAPVRARKTSQMEVAPQCTQKLFNVGGWTGLDPTSK